MLPRLTEFPAPPPGKRGWPWTNEFENIPVMMPNGQSWPKIIIVTPSYNQGQFIEETIRSVLLQNYPNLEYLIIDGGSTDQTVDIIKKYEPWLTYWVSEQDKGQSHAINKGFALCSGDIYNWLCSDDLLLPQSLKNIAFFMQMEKPCWLIGGAYRFDERSKKVSKREAPSSFDISNLMCWKVKYISQSSVFWNNQIHKQCLPINERLHYTMDIDLWLRFYLVVGPLIVQNFFSTYRLHEASKTTNYSQHTDKLMRELSNWMLVELYQSKNDFVIKEVLKGIISQQEDMSAFERIRKHIVLGKFLSLWKKWINKDFPV